MPDLNNSFLSAKLTLPLTQPSCLVSVVIPCYKNALTIGRAVNSVLAQSYQAIEVIVVNDCSPESDAIESVLRHITKGSEKVTYCRNVKNMGVAATRNFGIALATGQYIALLDADDEYHVDKIAVQVAHAEPGFAQTCSLVRVAATGSSKDCALTSRESRTVTHVKEILWRNTLNGAGLFIDRELLLAHGAYDESLHSCEDYDLWLRLLASGVKVKDIGQSLYFYYDNSAGLSKNFLSISKWEAEVIRRYADRQGNKWKRSLLGLSVTSVWLLRQMLRSELQKNDELKQQTLKNIDLLFSIAIMKYTFRFIAKSRILYLPSLVIRRLGSLRGL